MIGISFFLELEGVLGKILRALVAKKREKKARTRDPTLRSTLDKSLGQLLVPEGLRMPAEVVIFHVVGSLKLSA